MGPEESVKGYKQFIFQYYDGKCLKRPGTGEPQNIFYPCIHFRALILKPFSSLVPSSGELKLKCMHCYMEK